MSGFVRAFCRTVVGMALLAGSVLPLSAQSPSGTITGRVFNPRSERYVANAQISVEGTNLRALTNDFGTFRLNGVPAGEATLRVTYAGSEPQTVLVDVPAGGTVNREVVLAVARVADEDEPIVLDAFQVAAERETNASAIAIAEQRFAPNIKNVVSADAFGDVAEGNIGEFVKYLPGVTVDYVAADVRTISVRGFGANFTPVSVDGARMASAASGASTRTFELEQVSINNVSRVEVVKVPMPEDPADTLGGSVNMVSKSAFERKDAELRYRAYLNFNDEALDFKKTPGPGEKETWKVLPGLDFDYTLPVNENFGIILTGLSSNQFNEQHRSQNTWRHVGGGASAAVPYLRQYTLQDGPKNSFRDSLSLKADWRIATNHILSAGAQVNYYKAFFGNRNINFNIGGDTPTSFSPNHTEGAPAGATVTQGGAWRDKLGMTRAANLRYTFDGRDWEVEAGLSGSISKSWYRGTTRGHFTGYNIRMRDAAQINYTDIGKPRPGGIEVLDAEGGALDPTDLSNYWLNTVTNNPLDARDEFISGFLHAKHDFDQLSFPFALKGGVDARRQERDIRRNNETYTYFGPDGVAGTDADPGDNSAAAFLDTRYSGEDPHFGWPAIEWPDPYRMWDVWQENPSHFGATASQAATNVRNRLTGSEFITEEVLALFLQAEARLMDNRLGVVTGVRFERTTADGLGPLTDPDAVFVRNADGTFARDDAGGRIRRPEAGEPGSVEEVRLVNQERAFRSKRSYDGYYPSLHLSYSATDDLVVRLAYAKTFGRPDFNNIIPNAIIDENEEFDLGDEFPGRVEVRNTGLKPYSADNYDLSVEYYFPRGGVISGSVFYKDIKDFFGTIPIGTALTPELAEELGVDYNRFPGWEVRSTLNVGEAEIRGWEFNYQQPLDFLGGWGERFDFVANFTKLDLKGERAADFRNFIDESGNLGITYGHGRWIVMVKLNYRGEQKIAPIAETTIPENGYDYYDDRLYLDLNVEFQLTDRLSAFANARNLTNVPQDRSRYGDSTPDYARFWQREEFGVQWTVGVKGSF